MEVTTLVGRASRICLQPWLPGLSSCVRIGVIQGLRVCAIIWYLFQAIQLVCVCTLAAMMDVTAADAGSEIPRTTLSHLGGGRSELSGWLLVVSQWAGVMAPPIPPPPPSNERAPTHRRVLPE